MEQISIKKNVITWTIQGKPHILNLEKIGDCYVKNKHFVRGKQVTPEILDKMSRIISTCGGEWWLKHLETIKTYKKLGISQLTKLVQAGSIGEGKYGSVHPYKNFAVKHVPFKYYDDLPRIDGKFESDMLQILEKKLVETNYTPHLIKIYQHTQGKNSDFIVMERADTNFFEAITSTDIDERTVKGILLQVIFTCAVWQRVLKNFRHNDLKTDNILLFLKPRKKAITLYLGDDYWTLPPDIPFAKIADFDYANLPQVHKNPKVGTKHALSFGCGQKGSKVYDIHLLLNSMYNHRENLPTSIKKWLEKQLPLATRGNMGKHLKWSRLKSPGDWEKILPSPEKLLQSGFFDEFRGEKKYPLWGIFQV